MLRSHVFIVNEESLPIHLKYLFVGVSAKENDNNIGLLADIQRVKQDDFIFFYIEGRPLKKGRFFGIFKAVDNVVYHLTGENAKNPTLPIKLIYRKKIIPYKVFPRGVLEWIALDKLTTYSKDLLWSLIYRKLKGGRGNTMLFPWETENLISLIENENDGKSLIIDNLRLDLSSYEICEGDCTESHNIGTVKTLLLDDIKKSETYFQAYILQNLELYNNEFFPEIFGRNIVWIGNEVFAGTGMQKIDIVTIEEIDATSNLYRLIELKHPKSDNNVNNAPAQLEYYINWAREDIGGHIIGGRSYNIKPVVLSLLPELINESQEYILNGINNLNTISASPEVWEMDYSLGVSKRL
jgi:hypothetical protein